MLLGPDGRLAAGPFTRARQELLDDTLRVVSLSFSYLGPADALASWYRSRGRRAYEFLVYDRLGGLHLAKERFQDAAGVYAAFADTSPLHRLAPLFRMRVIDALDKGARIAVGGQRHPRGGQFFEPTVLLDVDPTMKVAIEETFGPVAPIFRFHDEEEAIAMANDTEFGLAAYFYARDIGRVWRVAEGLEVGIVGINEGIISTEVAPFGGVKESGLGREGSKYGIEEFVELKYLSMGLGSAP
jgi:succinate-semialdehyde dehydrogenase/glutarate-semialdehyde dehydrogenase